MDKTQNKFELLIFTLVVRVCPHPEDKRFDISSTIPKCYIR